MRLPPTSSCRFRRDLNRFLVRFLYFKLKNDPYNTFDSSCPEKAGSLANELSKIGRTAICRPSREGIVHRGAAIPCGGGPRTSPFVGGPKLVQTASRPIHFSSNRRSSNPLLVQKKTGPNCHTVSYGRFGTTRCIHLSLRNEQLGD